MSYLNICADIYFEICALFKIKPYLRFELIARELVVKSVYDVQIVKKDWKE